MRLLLLALVTIGYGAMAQQQLSLDNLEDFEPQAGNWMVVSDVVMNRNIDVHHKPAPEPEVKKKKKKKKAPVVEPPKAVNFSEGTGILLNINDKEKRDQIVTKWEHGDIELEFEVMLPKGSNSGVYLQGRYELQLYDSWGVKSPKFSDIGGIYENHSKDPATKQIGIPPVSNACKAPGLWQKFKLHFQAPRFDESGNKIKNAKFVYVDLNGVRIHSHVEVAMPTGGPISKDEVSAGPLMIQGDHGPVAFRNFRYTLIADSEIEIQELTYKVFDGEFSSIKDVEGKKPGTTGTSDKIDIALTKSEDQYAIFFDGKLTIPKNDLYTFRAGYSGGLGVIVDGDTLIHDPLESSKGEKSKNVRLSKGSYPITVFNFKKAPWRNPALGLYINGKNSNEKSFHSFNSFQESASTVAPIFVNAGSTPRLLRGFVTFGESGPKLSHTIGVATPENLNFVYDLNTANLIGVWRGNFADLTPMWFRRGNATFVPRGTVQWTFLNQPLAELASMDSPFPEQADFEIFKPKGYKIDPTTGLPIFRHIYKDVEVLNAVDANESNDYLVHRIKFSKSGLVNWYQKLAAGNIRKMEDGSYAVNDQQYYINLLSNQQAIIRKVDGVQELIVPADGSEIIYEIIW